MILVVLQAVLISLTGVISPGPMTAATLATAARPSGGRRGSPHAGALIALGHAVVEMPLIFLIIVVVSVRDVLDSPAAKIALGLVGGTFLFWMGVQTLLDLRKGPALQGAASGRRPLVIGIILSGANPFFLLWWATAGLLLASQVAEKGTLALALFAVIHWLCDLVWLEALSLATYHGSRVVGARAHKVFLGLCAAAILFFAEMFLWDAGGRLWDAAVR